LGSYQPIKRLKDKKKKEDTAHEILSALGGEVGVHGSPRAPFSGN
jgi:hypothetical protein